MIQIPRDWLVLDIPLNWDAKDHSGNWINWVATNITRVDTDVWYQTKAAHFNWSSSYITVWDASGIWFDELISVSFWIKADFSTTTNNYLMWFWQTGSSNNYSWAASNFNNNKIYFGYTSQAWWYENWVLFDVSQYNNQWIHVVLIYSHNRVYNDISWFRAFVNGKEQILANASLSSSYWYPAIQWPNVLWRRNWASVTNWYMLWDLWVYRIYNKILSEQDIEKLYLELLRKLYTSRLAYPKMFEWLVAYYDFRNGDLSNLIDGSLAVNNWATLTSDHLGYENSAYRFDWSNDKITWPTLNLWTEFTIQTIAKINFKDYGLVLWINPDNFGFEFITYANWDIKVYKWNWSSRNWPVVYNWQSGQWYDLVATFNGSVLKFYVDWNYVWQFSDSSSLSWQLLLWSRADWLYPLYWDISSAILFWRALSDDEVATLHNLLMS